MNYPCLMISKDRSFVVKFTSKHIGTVVKILCHKTCHKSIGYSSKNWVSAEDTTIWTPYKQTIKYNKGLL